MGLPLHGAAPRAGDGADLVSPRQELLYACLGEGLSESNTHDLYDFLGGAVYRINVPISHGLVTVFVYEGLEEILAIRLNVSADLQNALMGVMVSSGANSVTFTTDTCT